MELMQRKLRYLNDLSFSLYHLCYYFSSMDRWDADRNRIISFKNSDENAVRFFITQSIHSIANVHATVFYDYVLFHDAILFAR